MQYLQICSLNFILLSNSESKTYFVLIGFLAFFAMQIFLRSVTRWSLSKVSNENRRALAIECMRWLSPRTCKHMECLHVCVYDCLCVCLCAWVCECKLGGLGVDPSYRWFSYIVCNKNVFVFFFLAFCEIVI